MKRDIKEIEYAVFDMDGTLLDTMYLWDSAPERLLGALGLECDADTREDVRSMTTAQVADYIIKKYGVSKSNAEICDLFNKTMEDFYDREADFKEGAKELLFALRKRGVGMCLATATDRHMVISALERLGICGMFDFILTCSELGASKVDPLIFNTALEMCRKDREKTWIFEDSHFALLTASKAGFPTVGVYDDSFAAFEDIKKEASDIYVNSLTEICRLLSEH